MYRLPFISLLLNHCNTIYIYIRSIVIYSRYCYMFVVLLHECMIMMREGVCIGKHIEVCIYVYDNVLKCGVSTQAHE